MLLCVIANLGYLLISELKWKIYFNSNGIINFRFLDDAVFAYQNNCWGETKFPQKFPNSCRMFALVHAHTHSEIPSLFDGAQKCVDNGNPRCSDTNLGLMKTCPI